MCPEPNKNYFTRGVTISTENKTESGSFLEENACNVVINVMRFLFSEKSKSVMEGKVKLFFTLQRQFSLAFSLQQDPFIQPRYTPEYPSVFFKLYYDNLILSKV